jgi:hypothetical protein
MKGKFGGKRRKGCFVIGIYLDYQNFINPLTG